MSSTRKTPEHLKSAKNLRGVAEVVVAEVAEGAGAEAAGAEAAGAEGVARSERQAARRTFLPTGDPRGILSPFVLVINVRFSQSC